MASIDHTTTAYLDGQGTTAQQELFQNAAQQIRDLYTAENPDGADDMEDMIAQQLVGAAELALGDTTLTQLGLEAADSLRSYREAMDRLAGGMIVAREIGLSVSTISEQTGISRPTIYKRTEG